MVHKEVIEKDSGLEGKEEKNLFFGTSIVSILALAIVSIIIFPSASNAVGITISGTLKTLKTKSRPNRKIGQSLRPIESVVLFLIFCQFIFFPQNKS